MSKKRFVKKTEEEDWDAGSFMLGWFIMGWIIVACWMYTLMKYQDNNLLWMYVIWFLLMIFYMTIQTKRHTKVYWEEE